jgi:hypothetical protein
MLGPAEVVNAHDSGISRSRLPVTSICTGHRGRPSIRMTCSMHDLRHFTLLPGGITTHRYDSSPGRSAPHRYRNKLFGLRLAWLDG